MSNSVPEDLSATRNIVPDQLPTLDETGAYAVTQGGFSLAASVTTDPLIGTIIGRYTLLKKLGEGGMGSVFLAEQSEPVKRQVALKLIRGATDSRTIIARFEAERQALAVMDHPNIARIYDGGTTSTHQPYFVMELVQGVPITEYCDLHRFTPRQRLELFVPICQAVQHAHQKGIIHRDLKPGNVLVTEVDGKPVPKVIDFGVAKATEQPLTDQSLGDTGAIVGTPTYMSPEQADPGSMDIDTRTDIYALGVMLYELLTGSTPIDAKQFKRGALLEMLRMVREVDPPRPSTKLSTAEALPSIAANRNVEPKQLQAMLRGDIDWIVMKALEKDRALRYETANGFAADVQRYLTGDAVLAHPPSWWYQLKKFIKRNKVQVIAACLVLLALVAGLAVSLWQMNRALVAEEQAKRDRDDKEISRREADDRAREVQSTLRFVTDEVLLSARTKEEGGIGTNASVREALLAAEGKITAYFAGQSQLEERVREAFGDTFYALHDTEPAIRQMEFLAERMERRHGAQHPETIKYLSNLAEAYRLSGKPLLAIPVHQRVKSLMDAIGNIEPEPYYSNINNLALSHLNAGQAVLAAGIFEKAIAELQSKKGTDNALSLKMMVNLASARTQSGEPRKALVLYEEVAQRSEKLFGADHLSTLDAQGHLAGAYLSAGRPEEALRSGELLLKQLRKKLGEDHPMALAAAMAKANMLLDLNRANEALPVFEATLPIITNRLGAGHLHTLNCLAGTAKTYHRLGKFARARELFEQAYQGMQGSMPAEHQSLLRCANNLASLYTDMGEFQKALKLHEETYRTRCRIMPEYHVDRLASLNNLSMLQIRMGDKVNGLAGLKQAYQDYRKGFGPDHPDSLTIAGNYASELLRAGHVDESLPYYDELVERVGKRLGKDSARYGNYLVKVSEDFLRVKRYAYAEKLLRTAHQNLGSASKDAFYFNVRSMLGSALLGQKKYADAEPLLISGFEGMKLQLKSIPPQGLANVREALDRLIQLYTETKKPDEVKKWLAEKDKLPKPMEKKN